MMILIYYIIWISSGIIPGIYFIIQKCGHITIDDLGAVICFSMVIGPLNGMLAYLLYGDID